MFHEMRKASFVGLLLALSDRGVEPPPPPVPVVPAALSVWQLAHSDWKIVLPFVPSCDGGLAVAPPCPATAAT